MEIIDFHKCCQNIIDNQEAKALNYAVNYAKAGLYMTDKREAKVQSLYLLNNMTHWRGDLAKVTREQLKLITKVWE